jgi:hypothetical protein
VGLNSSSDCTYLSVELNGRKVSLQLNTGYQCNVVVRNFIPNVELKPLNPEYKHRLLVLTAKSWINTLKQRVHNKNKRTKAKRPILIIVQRVLA